MVLLVLGLDHLFTPIREVVDPSRPDIKIPLTKREATESPLDDVIKSRRGYEKVERELADLFGKKRSRSSRLILVLIA